MPYYVKIESQKFGVVTAMTGTAEVAERLSNTNNDVAGADFAYLYQYTVEVEQPHNETGAANASSAPFTNQVTLLVPDYESIISHLLNVHNGIDTIDKLTLNITARVGGQETKLGWYEMTNGMIVDTKVTVQDQRQLEKLKHRGEIELTLKFQKIEFNDARSNTTGSLVTTS